jgi:hypothetical protein
MSDPVPRLRMFAGPNGSGKTTVKSNMGKSSEWFGLYINPDEIEQSVRDTGFLSLESFGFTTTPEAVREFFARSEFLRSQQLETGEKRIVCRDGGIDFGGGPSRRTTPRSYRIFFAVSR